MLIDVPSAMMADFNARALEYRGRFQAADRASSTWDTDFMEARLHYPYFGYISVAVDGCDPFVMFSNNDDLVAQHYFWYGANGYEPVATAEWLRRAAHANVVYDIGAFSGLYGLLAHFQQASTPSVYLFEPTYRAFSRVLENLQANFVLDTLNPHRLAFSDRARDLEFRHFRGRHEVGTGASYLDKSGEITFETEICKSTSLDDFLSDNPLPDLVKIDVETAEVAVLRGAGTLLAQRSTTVFIEVVEETMDDVFELFAGYNAAILDEGNGVVVDYTGSRDQLTDALGTEPVLNLVFTPKD